MAERRLFNRNSLPFYWTTLSFWLAVLLNILAVSLFETVFYFQYATLLEREVLESDIDRYTDLLARQIQHITDEKGKERIVNELNNVITSLDKDYKASVSEHKKQKRTLFTKAIVYEAIIVVLVLLLLGGSALHRYFQEGKWNTVAWMNSLHLKHIMGELVAVLVLYIAFDFAYVNFVMKKWQSMNAIDFQRHVLTGSGIQNRTLPTISKKYKVINQVLDYFNEKAKC